MLVNLVATPLPDLPATAVAESFIQGWNTHAAADFRVFTVGQNAPAVTAADDDVVVLDVELLRTAPQGFGKTFVQAFTECAKHQKVIVVLDDANAADDGQAVLDAVGDFARLEDLAQTATPGGARMPELEVWVDHLDPYFAPGAGLAGALGGPGVGLRRPSEKQVPDLAQHSAKLALATQIGEDIPDAQLQRAVGTPGAGCGNGVGLLLAALGASFEPRAKKALAAQGFSASLVGADLVVVVQETFDWRDLRESLAEHVCEQAAAVAVPVALACGATGVGRREQATLGLASVSVASDQMIEPYGAAGPRLEHPITAGDVRCVGERVARTWQSN